MNNILELITKDLCERLGKQFPGVPFEYQKGLFGERYIISIGRDGRNNLGNSNNRYVCTLNNNDYFYRDGYIGVFRNQFLEGVWALPDPVLLEELFQIAVRLVRAQFAVMGWP